ncbi:MAG: phosphate ABC transporter substrate-binding protein PstS [Bacteroidetes bacterium]|nr:MAG: phosphate ABC transporter substrate-binding protein PstS [Bacteroidota bacterium]
MKKISLIIIALMIVLTLQTNSQNIKALKEKAMGTSEILGAGATFPFPFYSKVFDEYNKIKGVKVNYQAIGSGGGIKQLTSKTVDFGATDAFMDGKELNEAGKPIVHIPTCLGAVVVTYNIPGNPKLKLTGDVVSAIFLGQITSWTDKRITSLNKGVKLPNQKIVVIHRSDGSGTTFIFSDYLTKVSKEWESKVGRGKSLDWPVGLGGKGNQGVAGLVQQTPGSIGYVELVYSKSNNMPAALIKNSSGNYIEPTMNSVSLSANIDLPTDTRVSLTNSNSAQGYPMSSFTWLILYKELNYNNRDYKHAKVLVDLIWWLVHNGEKYAQPLNYSPLPQQALKKAETILKSVTYNGKPILK